MRLLVFLTLLEITTESQDILKDYLTTTTNRVSTE